MLYMNPVNRVKLDGFQERSAIETMMAAGNETCITMIKHLAQKNDKLETGLEEQKRIQLEAKATIKRLEGKLEGLQTRGSRLKTKLELEEQQRNITTRRVDQLEAKLEDQLSKCLKEQKQKIELQKNTTTRRVNQLELRVNQLELQTQLVDQLSIGLKGQKQEDGGRPEKD